MRVIRKVIPQLAQTKHESKASALSITSALHSVSLLTRVTKLVLVC